MSKTFSLAVALSALALTSAAEAADLPRRSAPVVAPYAAPAPAFSWRGAYAGLNAGYGWGTNTGSAAKNTFGQLDGGQVGGTVGYNYQSGQFVAGVEGDWDWNGASDGKTFATAPAASTTSAKLTNTLTARGRVGYALDRALLFATGGYAGGTVKRTVVDGTTAPATGYSTSDWHNGYALGAGMEYAFTNNVSAKAEYLYTNLSSKSDAGPFPMRAGASQSTVRGGVNYHF